MKHSILVAGYLVVMGALIATIDVLFLRDLFWLRLGINTRSTPTAPTGATR